VMLTIGRANKHKGCDIWIDVVEKLDADQPKRFKYVFIGADKWGPCRCSLLALRDGHIDVVLKPTLPHEDVIQWICASDLLLVPSRTESFALKAIEALYCGCPVVTHYLGILLDVIRDGVNGAIVDYMDVNALTNAAAEWLIHPHSVKAGIPERYFANKMVERYEACFKEILGKTHKYK
ncbi:MAG: glycosyltransferase family 4 protein, partial [Phycisphaerales bacterium]